jgi:hypothetical protein
MNASKLYLLISFLILWIFSTGDFLFAQESLKIQVVSTKIVLRIEGVAGKAYTWKKAKHTKGIIVSIKATIPNDMKIWSTDFTISYQLDNVEHKRTCKAMQTIVSSIDDDGVWIIGLKTKFKAKKGVRYFKLLFPIDNKIKTFSLQFAKPVIKGIEVDRNGDKDSYNN